jgi:hypothetical protein
VTPSLFFVSVDSKEFIVFLSRLESTFTALLQMLILNGLQLRRKRSQTAFVRTFTSLMDEMAQVHFGTVARIRRRAEVKISAPKTKAPARMLALPGSECTFTQE